jgi:AcrR family transcriptional regulator
MAGSRQRQSKDRRQEILTAAAQVIIDRGLADTRIADVADRCGISPGLILYYFDSKDRLLVEALANANDKFYLRLSRELRQVPSATEQLRLLIELSIPRLRTEPEEIDDWALWIEIWVRALRDPKLAEERETLDRQWRRSIADVIIRGRESGEFPDGLGAEDLGIAIAAMIDGLAIQVLMNDTAFTPSSVRDLCMAAASRMVGLTAVASTSTS